MRLCFLALLFVPSVAIAKVVPFPEPIALSATECHSAAVNFEDGKMVTDDGVTLSGAFCRIDKNFSVVCAFLDNDKNIKHTVVFTGGITGDYGVLQSDDFGNFILDIKSRRFFANNSISVKEGKIRGARLCSGSFLYQSELGKK